MDTAGHRSQGLQWLGIGTTFAVNMSNLVSGLGTLQKKKGTNETRPKEGAKSEKRNVAGETTRRELPEKTRL